jgi:hypothetical protein
MQGVGGEQQGSQAKYKGGQKGISKKRAELIEGQRGAPDSGSDDRGAQKSFFEGKRNLRYVMTQLALHIRLHAIAIMM